MSDLQSVRLLRPAVGRVACDGNGAGSEEYERNEKKMALMSTIALALSEFSLFSLLYSQIQEKAV